MGADATESLFIYGLLLREDLQLDTFGRHIEPTPDTLPGFRLGYADVDAPQVFALTGLRQHPVARETGNPLDKIVGVVIRVTFAELDAADEYAAPGYRRRRATLDSGLRAWLYVPVSPPPAAD